ncbi:MAG TPA: flippase activity-associated protein Agl23 [Candidatus Xenobia bacterium]
MTLPDPVWWGGSAAVVLVAIVLRFYDINRAVDHHDEGVNGNFLVDLVRHGVYHYDPTNYHGPTLYFLALPFVKLLGLTNTAVRAETACFGVLCVLLLLCLQKEMGRLAALIAAMLWAVSPGSVFISRYFIHEMLFCCFTLGMLVPLLYVDKLGRLWSSCLASLSAALLFATKETAILTVLAMGVAEFSADYFTPKHAEAPPEPPESPIRTALVSISSFCTFVITFCLFYSSFFTWPQGVLDGVRALRIWTNTGKDSHVHPWDQYFQWMSQMEMPILLLGLFGIVIILALWRTRFNLFLALWGLFMLGGYSAIPYKTPWLDLNILLPLACCAGVGLSWLSRYLTPGWIVGIVGLCAAISTAQAWDLSLLHYDDDSLAYVYAHTTRQFTQMLDVIDRDAKAMGKGNQASIVVTSPEYWPMPWYLRDWPNVGYYSKVTFVGTHPDMIVGLDEDNNADPTRHQTADIMAQTRGAFTQVGKWALRPGINLVLFERTEEIKH